MNVARSAQSVPGEAVVELLDALKPSDRLRAAIETVAHRCAQQRQDEAA